MGIFFVLVPDSSGPALVNFQGKLVDNTNNPENGLFSMTFSVWDASSGGTMLWSETQPSVPVANRIFGIHLGSVTPLPSSVFTASNVYLQMDVAGETATTRERIQTLESILNRFGADGTDMVMRELAMLRKKVFGK